MEQLNSYQLTEVNGGNPILRKLLEGAIINQALDIMESAYDDFMDGWNSHECGN